MYQIFIPNFRCCLTPPPIYPHTTKPTHLHTQTTATTAATTTAASTTTTHRGFEGCRFKVPGLVFQLQPRSVVRCFCIMRLGAGHGLFPGRDHDRVAAASVGPGAPRPCIPQDGTAGAGGRVAGCHWQIRCPSTFFLQDVYGVYVLCMVLDWKMVKPPS